MNAVCLFYLPVILNFDDSNSWILKQLQSKNRANQNWEKTIIRKIDKREKENCII